MKFLHLILALVLLFLAGCNALTGQISGIDATQTAPTIISPTTRVPTSVTSSTPEAVSTGVSEIPSATPDLTNEPLTLNIWVPPQFDPNVGTSEGRLLNQRLEEFISRRPDITLNVRVKAMEGAGGLLDALSSASAAAPDILPDLVALPRPLMEAAALKGLLHPYDGLSTALENADWYDYALQLARLQKSTFGLPFAGDALILMYRPSVIGDPPKVLSDTQTIVGPLSFPASDPQALLTLTLYQAAGGAVQDEQGRPALDPDILAQVLSFYQKANQTGLAPAWLTQYETDDQSWSAFIEGKANLAITWTSRYLAMNGNQVKDMAAATLPTLDGSSYTQATGWVWALAGSQTKNQAAAVQLAEFLTESDFMARWTAAAGFLPTRASALTAWPDSALRKLSGQVMLSAHPFPPADVLTSLVPVLRQATVQILNKQGDPLPLAQEAADRLNSR
jgi:multiple sugar transport system substrate-binding protein